MLLKKYLQTIEALDPGKIYVENIRSFFHVPRYVAKLMCEMAVVDNLFEKRIGLKCPGCSRIISSYSKESDIPEYITCDICENDDKEEFEFKSSDLQRITFYKLKKVN
jgi:hypothetical protein